MMAQRRPETLEEVMGKVLHLLERHPEWYRRERTDTTEDILRELMRL